MGIFTSKVDVEAIATIESNVVDLIIRLNEEEGTISAFVKNYLLKALQVYTTHIEKENKKGYISRHKTCRLKDLIASASAKVREFSTEIKYEPETFYTVGRDPRDIKNHLFEIERYVNTHKLEEAECDSMLKLVVAYLQNGSSRLLKSEEEDVVSSLVLKLFLKSSVTTVASILDRNVNQLDTILESFEKIKTRNVNTSNAGEIRTKLMEINSRVETINHVSLGIVKEIDKQAKSEDEYSGVYDLNLLEKVADTLKACYSVVEKFSPPVAPHAVARIKNRVMPLIYTQLDKLLPNCKHIADRKNFLIEQGVHILNTLQNIDAKNRQVSQTFSCFEDIAKRIGKVSADTDLKFREKIRFFDSIKGEIDQIDATNNEIRLQKIEITNTLIGFQTIESSNYLRQMMKTLNHCKMYAQQFPFPKNVSLYQTKIKEIHSLEGHLQELPKGSRYVDKRIHKIHDFIHEVLGILGDKAKANQHIASLIEEIDRMEQEIINAESPGGVCKRTKLKIFNDTRENLNLIDNLNKRIVSRKLKVRSRIHKIEDEIYAVKFPQVFREMKSVLNRHENEAEAFQLAGRDVHQRKKDEILSLSGLYQKDIISAEFFKIFDHTVKLVMDLLDKTYNENRIRSDHSNKLQWIDSSLDKKVESFGIYKSKLNTVKAAVKYHDHLLDEVIKLETKIDVEHSKVVLTCIANSLHESKMNIRILTRPINTDVFKEYLNDLFLLKDRIDDMPEGDSDLNLQKQTHLRKIYKVLELLDEQLAKVVENQKQPENILDLQNRFNDFNPDALGPKNSIQFVQAIRRRAESFEESVKYYMGSSCSVDYYVLHENLLRLLEELDRVVCSDDNNLLEEMVATMGYIKSLMELLSSNASFE